MQRLTEVVKHLLIINILFYIADMTFNLDMLALRYPGSDEFMPIQIVTHFFMHSKGSLMHIFFNMFALFMFGPPLEKQWGAKRFLIFYLICAFGAAALHMAYSWWDLSQMQDTIQAFKAAPDVGLFQEFFAGEPLSDDGDRYVNQMADLLTGSTDPQVVNQAAEFMEFFREEKMGVPVVGASGAIYGLLLAFGMYYPNVELMLIFLPIPIKAKYFIPIMMLVELFLGFNQFSWDNIAHFAHLGGALTGFLLILYWRKFDNPYQRH